MKKILFLMLITTILGFTSRSDAADHLGKNWVAQQLQLIKKNTPNIDSKILRLGLMAYQKAYQAGIAQKQILTVIDFTQPSTAKRLWVFDLKNGKNLFNTWVSHGKNTGNVYAKSFSNYPGTFKSSIGVFLTEHTYFGKNGYSLRLKGLERGINDNAYSRSIVMHGAHYVSADRVSNGFIGRSWGCPAVSVNLAKPLIHAIKDKSVLFAYYPDHKWLTTSKFI